MKGMLILSFGLQVKGCGVRDCQLPVADFLLLVSCCRFKLQVSVCGFFLIWCLHILLLNGCKMRQTGMWPEAVENSVNVIVTVIIIRNTRIFELHF